ncbi:hypothetical protein CR513_46673, partial [Mucuna pruriens]
MRWVTRKGKQSVSHHWYATRSKSKAMENKVEALEQHNQDLKGEMSQLKEQMAQMFQILSQTNAAITAMANQGAMGYAQLGYPNDPPPHNIRDLPYGIPYGWKIEGPAIEEHEKQNAVNNNGAKGEHNTGSGAEPKRRRHPGTK